MSTTISITDEQLTLEVKKSVCESLPTEYDKERAANTLTNSLDTEEVKKMACDDVKDLAQTIRQIRSMFKKISATFVGFDGAKFKDKTGKELRLAAQWMDKMNTFEDVMQASYENATSAVLVMKEITNILDMDVNEATEISIADFKHEIDSFIKQVDKKKTAALETKNSFQSLADDVRLFCRQIDLVLEQADKGLIAELAGTRQRISVLSEQLEILSKEILHLAVELTSALAIGIGAGLAAFFAISPLAAGVAIGSFASAVYIGKMLADTRAKKKVLLVKKAKAEEDLNDILARQTELLIHLKTFEDTKAQITLVAKKIDTISNIWLTINLDMLSIMDSLQKNFSQNAKITRFFWLKLAPTKETYKRLTECLETYVEQSRSVYVEDD